MEQDLRPHKGSLCYCRLAPARLSCPQEESPGSAAFLLWLGGGAIRARPWWGSPHRPPPQGHGCSFSYLPPAPQWQAPAGFAPQALLGILTPLPLALPKTLSAAAIVVGRHSPLPIPVPLLSFLSELLTSHTAPLAECQRTLAVSDSSTAQPPPCVTQGRDLKLPNLHSEPPASRGCSARGPPPAPPRCPALPAHCNTSLWLCGAEQIAPALWILKFLIHKVRRGHCAPGR